MKTSDDKTKSTQDKPDVSEEIITLRRELEIQRRVAYAEGLFQGDVTIRTMLEALAEGVVIIDNIGTIVLVNNQTEKLFGYNKEVILGCSLDKLIPSRYQIAHDNHVQSYFEKPRIRPMGLGRELKGLHKNGHEFPVEISLSYLETTGRQLAMAFVTDITLRKEAEDSLKSRNEELDAFAHTVAHDLKGSLTPLSGYCQLLTDPDIQIKDQHIYDALNKICRVSHKMANVIDEILLLSSVRKEDVTVSVLDMRPIIHSVIVRLNEEYENYGQEIQVVESFPKSYGHAPWIEEVWYNYISNAIKYGGKPPKISVGGELRDDGFANFWVKDNGQGVKTDQLAQIFTPYLPRQNSSDSHGLGLSIVKRIVEKLNGDVGLQNNFDKGSTFSFTLPTAE